MSEAPTRPIAESSESAACTSHHAEASAPLTVRPPRRSTDVLLFFACASSIAACAWWALALDERPDVGALGTGESARVLAGADSPAIDLASSAALDLAAFRTPIWVAPPLPPAPAEPPPQPKPEPPPPPPPPLKWQLLAIVRAASNALPHAMIYDPESDRVLELAAGDAHSGATISAVHADRVIIQRGRHTHTLLLDPRIAATPSPAEGVP
ncbi:MAG: hypothetical protein KF699_16640 [Phycisphaeraceae bacterium]|nr:hypothetical protein [Phycisphaeraceae bacterium]